MAIIVHKCNMGIGSRKFVVGICFVLFITAGSYHCSTECTCNRNTEANKISAIIINTNKYTMIKEQSGLISI